VIAQEISRVRIHLYISVTEKPNYVGSFEERVNNVIANCRYFILLINIATLGREQVIRECKRAYPNGLTEHPKFVIFREDLECVERRSETFLNQTRIDISKENQHDFRTNSELANRVSILCIKGVFVLVKDTTQPIEHEPHISDSMVTRNRTSVEKFRDKMHELGLWKYFEIKIFLFKSSSKDISWKVQFLYIRLLEHPPNQLVGLTTAHLRLVHMVLEIDELKNILYQITSTEKITLNNISASLGLIPNEIKYNALYRSHPQGGIFGVNEACYEVIKSGISSIELAENLTILISELEGSFDNLPDAIANRLGLSFWDGMYAPFVVVLAPIPIEIVTAEISNQHLLMTLNCSLLIEPRRLEVMSNGRNMKGRQVGSAISIKGFRRLDSGQISLDTNILLNNAITDLTVRLLYYDDLIEERYFKKDQISNEWVQS
jgi:hypothetical protein